MKRAILTSLFILTCVISFPFPLVTLSVTPAYLLPGENVKLVATLSSTQDMKYVVIKLLDNSSTITLYNPVISGKNYIWNYVTSKSPKDYKALAEIFLNSTSTEIVSNIATFTTNIPAASVNSTVIYDNFITNSAATAEVSIKNIGSEVLKFTTYSSPSELKISPSKGEIESGQARELKITVNASLVPGQIYTFDAYTVTNDPRENMKKLLLARILEGPDGLVVSPISISSTRASVGSDVNFDFSIFHSGITVKNVTVMWHLPQGGQKTFSYYLPSNNTHFSSTLRLSNAGEYDLSTVKINYIYQNEVKTFYFFPKIKVEALSSFKKMSLNIGKNDAVVKVISQSTPTIYAEDGKNKKKLSIIHPSPSTWTAFYNYSKIAGPLTFYATFCDVNYVLSKTVNRYVANSEMADLSFDDEGWLTITKDTFSSTSVIALFYEGNEENLSYYSAYNSFMPVSDVVTVASSATPVKKFIYHLRINIAMVNGFYDKLKIYKEENGKWISDSATPIVIPGEGMVSFKEDAGTYAVGISPNVSSSSTPKINSFVIMPRKALGKTVQFFISVDKDCYYKLEIYDMRSSVVDIQSGKAIKNLGNLIYTLDTSTLPNGLYVAIVSVGSSPNEISDKQIESFSIVK
ncbi:BACON domain-containing protein [Mesoaciditoga sp.]